MNELKFPFKFRAIDLDPVYTARFSGENHVEISWYNDDDELRTRMYNLADVAENVARNIWRIEKTDQTDPEVIIKQSDYDSLVDEINMLREIVAEITLQSDFNSLEQQAEAFRVLNDKMLSHQSYKQGDGGSTRIGELSKQLDVLFAAYDSLACKPTERKQNFKPVSEMTLEDWQQALGDGALFEYYDGSALTLTEIDTRGIRPRIGFKEQPFLFSEDGNNLESGYRIKRRIK